MLNRKFILPIIVAPLVMTSWNARAAAATPGSVRAGSLSSASTTVLAASTAAAAAAPNGSTQTSLGSTFIPAPSVASGVLAFQAWKQSQIDDAKSRLEKAQGNLLAQPRPNAVSEGGSRFRLGRAEQLVRQAQVNVEIAQELTVNDYFVLYLNQFKTKDAFLDVAKKLTPDETADLLFAYQKSLASSATDRDQLEVSSSGLISSTPPTVAFGKKR